MTLSIHDPLEGTPYALDMGKRVEKKVKRVNEDKDAILAEIARLKAENEALKAKKAVKAPEKASCDKTDTVADKCTQIDTAPAPAPEPETQPKPVQESQPDTCELTIEQVAQRQFINGGRSGKLVDLKYCGHHMIADDGTVYADTNFLYAADKVSGSELKHLGFGDFKAVLSDGKEVVFMRDDDYPIPGKVGRAHWLKGDSETINSMLKQCVEQGLSLDMTGVKLVEKPAIEVLPEQPVSTPAETVKTSEDIVVPLTTTAVVEVSFKPEPEPQQPVRDTSNWPAWRKRMYGIK